MEKVKIENYTPMPDRILLEEPEVNMELDSKIALAKASKMIQEEKANWINDGKPLKVAKDFMSSDEKIKINKGEYIVLSGQWGITRIVFEDADRLQFPITSIAGKVTV